MSPCPRCRRHVLPGGTCPFCGQALSNVDQVCAGDRCYSAEPMTNLVYGPPPVPRPSEQPTVPLTPDTSNFPPRNVSVQDRAERLIIAGIAAGVIAVGVTVWFVTRKD